MKRNLFAVALGAVLCISGVTRAAVYDNIYWIGGSGEWTGDLSPDTSVTPDYFTGHWSNNPAATLAQAKPAKFVLGRNDGIRTGQTIGSGGYDLDRLPCDSAAACTTTPAVTIAGGTQLGTDVFINTGATVTYQANRQLLAGDDTLDRFGDLDFRYVAAFPGTPTLNLSNGSIWTQQTSAGGDADGMWTRWNGAELNIDGVGTKFIRTADRSQGFSGGAMMFGSFNGVANMVQTASLTNGGRIENDGQFWFGVSGTNANSENPSNRRAVMTINNGHMDLSGGDAYELDNDGLPMRGDLAFVYDWKGDGDATNDEFFAINFTGPGDITVDGDEAAPLDGDTSTGGGGIRVATNTAASGPSNYGSDATIQRSYQDLWNMGILSVQTAADLAAGLKPRNGLTGHTFGDYFSVTGTPGSTNYKLTSLLPSPAANGRVMGDYNNNGTVDAADYVIYRNTLGSTTDLRADGNGSLNIDAADLVHWRKNFGTTGLPTFGSGAGSSAEVPEPSTALLVIVGLASLWLFKRK